MRIVWEYIFAHSPPSSLTWIDEDTDQSGRSLVRTRIICVPSICTVNKERVDSHTFSKMCVSWRRASNKGDISSLEARGEWWIQRKGTQSRRYSWSTLAPKVSGWINNVSVQVYDTKNDWRRCQSIVIASSDHERQIRDYVLMFLNANTMIWFTNRFVWRKEKEEKMKNRSFAWSIWGREIELFSLRSYLEGFEKD